MTSIRAHFMFAAAQVGLCAAGQAGVAATDRPNIVILFADDMGVGQPSCYGSSLAPTPHIDALAAHGVRFSQAYASAPVCSPSRVGLMTGRYQARSGHDGLTNEDPGKALVKTETLLSQRLKAAGYSTGLVGKWHLGSAEGYRPNDRGFDSFYGSYSNKNEVETYHRNARAVAKPKIDSPAFAEEAVRFIEQHQREPFFLYVAFTAVHAPVEASGDFLQRFANVTPERRQVYAAMVAELDAAVGAITAKLRAAGLEENTMVVFSSDNGGADPSADNGPHRGGKWSLLEGGIREPLIIQWPRRVRGGQTCDTPAILLDVFPTALAAAGIAIQREWNLDGANLLPLLTGETKSLARDTFYWRFGPQFAIRRGGWKLVRAEKDEPAALYNVVDDPGESRDLAGAQPALAAELLAKWERWDQSMQPSRWSDPRFDGLRHRKELLEQRNRTAQKKKKSGPGK